MQNTSLGIIEIQGLLGAITIADVMVKSANVKVAELERAKGFGWTTVKILGDVGAVKAAIEAGGTVASSMGLFVTSKVIARPSADVLRCFLPKEENKLEMDATPEVEGISDISSTTDVVEEEEQVGIVQEVEPLLDIESHVVEIVTAEDIPTKKPARTSKKRASKRK